jgi:uncharacterized protein YqgC (DUF456 family)
MVAAMFGIDPSGVSLFAVWLVTGGLLFAGMVGCVLPLLPGHWILLMAAISHRLLLGSDGSGLHWWSFAVLLTLMALSQLFETLSGAAGAKCMGGSKWGIAGALIGTLVGLFFLPFGLLLGPLAGAFLAEILSGRDSTTAAKSGVGSAIGVLAGMGIKILFGALMTLWILIDALLI